MPEAACERDNNGVRNGDKRAAHAAVQGTAPHATQGGKLGRDTKNQGARPARRPTHTGDREGVTTGNDHARPKGRRACKEANTHGRPRGAVTHDPQSCKHSTCTGDREGS